MRLVVLTENVAREGTMTADQLGHCQKIANQLQAEANKEKILFVIKDRHENYSKFQTIVTTTYDFWKSREQLFNRLPYDAEIMEDK